MDISLISERNSFLSKHIILVSGLFGFILLLTWFIYQPALSGPFMLDDFDNLGALKGGVSDSVSLKNYLSNGNAGPLGRPIAKLSFLLDDNAWPSSPESFKRTNLLIHLLTGVFVFCAFRILFKFVLDQKQSDWFALLISAFFLVHPLQVSTVMYVVQRMTQLSGLFVITGVTFHLYWRSRFDSLEFKHLALMSITLIAFTLLAVLSKESGILLPVYLLVTELTVLASKPSSRIFLWWRRLCITLPSVVLLVYLSYLPRWLGSYANRDFTLTERLLTEPVVLLDYLSSITSMRVAGLGLFQDDYPIYPSLMEPTVFLSLLSISVSIGFALKLRKKYPLVSFGVLWFFAGHIIESTTVSLELYFEHRNYIPLIGPLVAVFYVVYKGLQKVSLDVAKLSPVFAGVVFTIASMTTWGYSSEWSSLRRIIPIWAAEHPDSPRAQRTYAQLLASMGLPGAALDVLDDAYQRFPYDLSLNIMSIDISCAFGRERRYEFNQLASVTANHRLTDGLRPALESLFGRILDTSCRDQVNELHALIAKLPELERAEHLRSAVASFYVLDGDMYLRERNGNGAINSYKMVDQLQPSKDSALRLAGIFIRVRDYDRAREMLQRALDRERSSGKGISASKEREYAEKFDMIDQFDTGQKNKNIM